MDDEVLPNLSVAVQVTIVSPSGNTSGASLVIIGKLSIMSSTEANPISREISVLNASTIIS